MPTIPLHGLLELLMLSLLLDFKRRKKNMVHGDLDSTVSILFQISQTSPQKLRGGRKKV